MNTLFTIGHSTHTLKRFLELLKTHSIEVVADVRSSPYSAYTPHFNRELLRVSLKRAGIKYLFLGQELGARSNDPSCYEDGRVRFDRLAASDLFRHGLDRLRTGIQSYRVAVLCAEKDPVECHRMVLVCRNMRSGPPGIHHILETGEIEDNTHAERRLMQMHHIVDNDLFASEEELINRAYDLQGKKIAYVAESQR
jgi:uncharacterized protein (DUF488 family)